MASPGTARGFLPQGSKSDAKRTLAEISQLLKSGDPIPAGRLTEWLASDDLEVLGACHEVLTERFDRLDAKAKTRFDVPSDQVCNRMLYFFCRCLVENRPGEYALNRRQAALGVYRWFLALLANAAVSRAALDAIKKMLAEVYASGDADLRDSILTSCLEHLFVSEHIAEYFAEWQDDPAMGGAFAAALEWGRNFWPGQRSRQPGQP